MSERKEGERIVFMGTPEFAVASFNALIDAGIDVAAVVTAPDRPAGRGLNMQMSAVKQRALEAGIHLLQPEKLKDPEFLAALEAINADLFVVVAFRMLPEIVWRMPRSGTINLHASLLPDYRGAAPINWVVINGETRTGLTTFFIKHDIDTGDIIQQLELEIGQNETAGELHDRMMMKGGELLANSVRDILAGEFHRTPQRVRTDQSVHHAAKLHTAGCRIDWTRTAHTVHNLVRGLSPYPGAWTTIRVGDKEALHCKVYRSRPVESGPTSAPGVITRMKDRLFVGCADALIEVMELQLQGRKRMTAEAFLRGVPPDQILFME